jgi:hypothetical protein
MLYQIQMRARQRSARSFWRETMLKSAFVMTTAAAIAFAGLSLQPAAAAPKAPGIGNQQTADFSAVRKKSRRHGSGFPVAAFGAIAGTIAGIAASERRREYYERPYGYGYAPGYYEAPVAAPYAYGPPAYQYRGYQGGYRGGYQGGYGGGYHGGYRGNSSGIGGESMTANPSPGH